MKNTQGLSRNGPPPFLKWAGGKRWLSSIHHQIVPGAYRRYVEPFLGGGAIFFRAAPTGALLSDVNDDLINVYAAIRDDPYKVQRYLKFLSSKHDREFYYEERSKNWPDRFRRAAQLIYLNRTCWNGLYRVNQSGKFNVPVGTKDSVLLPTDDFGRTSALLKSATLRVSDFQPIIDACGKGDFLFLDPPYTVKHNNNGFLKYNEKVFRWEDQERLKSCVEAASVRGAKFTLTNANHQSIRHLYSGLGDMIELPRHSVLASKSDFRGATSELLIRNWIPGEI